MELALADALTKSECRHHTGEFASALINDEYIWEAYGIPMASLSRYPYPEYHTDRDTVSLMSDDSLEEAVSVLLQAIDTLEASSVVRKRFSGNICLSHPAYDLYIDPGQVAFGDIPDDQRRRMRHLMDIIPTLTRPTSTSLLAGRVGLSLPLVEDYLERWAHHGLLELS